MTKEVDQMRYDRELYEMRSFLQDLENSDWQIRVKAISGLVNVKKTADFYNEALPKVLKISEDNNEIVRQALIPFLGELGSGGAKAVPTLIKFLYSRNSSEIKSSIYSLGKIGSDAIDSLPRMLELLATDDDDQHKAISWSLSMMGAEAVNPLIKGTEYPDIRVQIGCISALGSMGPIAANSLTKISSFLSHTNSKLRGEAARSIGNLRAVSEITNYVKDLITILQDEDPNVRWLVAEALRKIGTEEAMSAWASYQDVGTSEAYLKQLNNIDKAVRLHAAEGLYNCLEINSNRDIEIIKKSLHDTYPKVVISICSAIAKLGKKGEPFEDTLVELLKHHDKSIRSACANCIGKISSSCLSTVNALINLLSDPEKEVRLASGLALELIDTKEAKAALKRFKWE